MKKLVDALIIIAAIGLVLGVIMKIAGVGSILLLATSTAWKLTVGCSLLAIALSVRQK